MLVAGFNVLTLVWAAATMSANAKATEQNVAAQRVQLEQLTSTTGQLKAAVDVLNCKVGITCNASPTGH